MNNQDLENAKPRQSAIWTNGEELPLFTGTAQKVDADTFDPKEEAARSYLPGMRPTFDEHSQPLASGKGWTVANV